MNFHRTKGDKIVDEGAINQPRLDLSSRPSWILDLGSWILGSFCVLYELFALEELLCPTSKQALHNKRINKHQLLVPTYRLQLPSYCQASTVNQLAFIDVFV
jgi:hypothetical protein